MNQTIKGVNVAPSSTSGHYIQRAKKVVNLDNVAETFLVVGESDLVTKNHTTLQQRKTCLITTQQVYNPFAQMFERSKD
jgi:hypothetical protein